MRLLNTSTSNKGELKLEEFGSNEIPPYSILSHTWGENEITFQNIGDADLEKKAGYEKVRETCSKAKADGFDYVWIDTCCM
jgi:hypothetical protein